MNIAPLSDAVQPIPVHALLAMAALVVGGAQFVLPKGTVLDRSMGNLWVITMFFVATIRFFII